MEAFKAEYLDKCREIVVEPHPAILNALSKIQNDNVSHAKLDLSGHALSIKEITSIAHALAKDVIFTKLIFSDAFMGDDGMLGHNNYRLYHTGECFKNKYDCNGFRFER
jgi:hypothetical protein